MGVRMELQADILENDAALTLDGDLAPSDAMRDITPKRLSPRLKAAVIVRLLLGQGVSPGVSRLPQEHQRALAHALAHLNMIDRTTLLEVVRDFTAQIDGLALSFPRSLPDAVEMLEPYLSETSRDALRAEISDGADPWTRVGRQDADRLRPLMESESAEVCAVLLSKLSVAKAAALLADLPAERIEVLTHTMALTETITPDLVDRIGVHVAGVLDAVPPMAFSKPATERVGAILNTTAKEAREQVLEGLLARNAEFGAGVKRSIFSFGHIPTRINPTDVPAILRQTDNETFLVALAAGLVEEPLSVEFLLENMSKRLAEQMRDEAEGRGTPSLQDGEAAMAAVVATIREMEESGEIKLLAPPE